MLPQPGDVLANKYRIEKLIGRGGMGAVFAAHHELLQQRVVLKVVLGGVEDEDGRARFMHEARASFKIKSEYVARVLDVDFLESGKPFMVLEYLEGCDLAKTLQNRKTPLEPALAVEYLLQALDALASAHGLGIVHRDLKPANLFVCDTPDGRGRIKVLDFGVAKSTSPHGGGSDEITVTKMVLGTPHYMSPEQLRSSRSVDARADIWAIGVILFELLTKRRPFDGNDYGEIFAALLERDAPSLLAFAPGAPPGLAAIVHRCLRRDPRERFADVAELARALAPFAGVPTDSILGRIDEAIRGGSARGLLATPLPGASADSTVAASPAFAPNVSGRPPPQQPSDLTGGAWQQDAMRAAPIQPRRSFVPFAVAGVALSIASVAIVYIATHRPPPVIPVVVAAPPPPPSEIPSASVAIAAPVVPSAEPEPTAATTATTATTGAVKPKRKTTPAKPRPSAEFDPTAARKP